MYQIANGKVIRGKGIGKELGFPTANIELDLDLQDGTYKINGLINGKIYKGAGVYFKDKKLFEGYFIDLEDNIYNKNIKICFHYKIRDNIKFQNYNDLINQVKKDIDFVKNTNDYVITFGTFDIIHPGHEYYLNTAKLFGDKLITVVSTDENAKRFKGVYPINNKEKRVENIKNLNISDIVCSGEETTTLKWVCLYAPKVVCLGYDQVGFIKELEDYIKKDRLDIKIIRIKPFKEDIYKSSKIRKILDERK